MSEHILYIDPIQKLMWVAGSFGKQTMLKKSRSKNKLCSAMTNVQIRVSIELQMAHCAASVLIETWDSHQKFVGPCVSDLCCSFPFNCCLLGEWMSLQITGTLFTIQLSPSCSYPLARKLGFAQTVILKENKGTTTYHMRGMHNWQEKPQSKSESLCN
jgi:hypothetical protein